MKKLIITLSLLAISSSIFASHTKNQTSQGAYKPNSNENSNPQGSSIGHQKSQDHYKKAAKKKAWEDYAAGRNALTCKVLRSEPISYVSQISPLHKKIVMGINSLNPSQLKHMKKTKQLLESGIGAHVRQTPTAKKAFEKILQRLPDEKYFAQLPKVYHHCLLYPPKTVQIPGLPGGYSITKMKRLEALKPA